MKGKKRKGKALKERLEERAKSRLQFVKCYLKGFISNPAAGPSGSSPDRSKPTKPEGWEAEV
ncbi:hypothetical protein HaLaN_30135, partial [Haematococcus lacustris]